jgi:collagenase-like PrtC family protease
MAELTLGPNLFHWPAEALRDFYFRIADEAPVGTVYLGEVVCSKRTPFFDDHLEPVAERLERAGKQVVFCSLSEVVIARERKLLEAFARQEGRALEVNNTAALLHLQGRPHRIGALMNVYNEAALAYLARRGATHFALLAELPKPVIAVLAEAAKTAEAGIEVQVFGRASLALSARCYHARAHGRVKDNCQFVCGEDPDGMALTTMNGQLFLAVNGIQTLSYTYVDLMAEMAEMAAMGVTHFRLMPHGCDMVAVARAYDDVLAGRIAAAEGADRLRGLGIAAPFSNGFYHGLPGHEWQPPGVAAA